MRRGLLPLIGSSDDELEPTVFVRHGPSLDHHHDCGCECCEVVHHAGGKTPDFFGRESDSLTFQQRFLQGPRNCILDLADHFSVNDTTGMSDDVTRRMAHDDVVYIQRLLDVDLEVLRKRSALTLCMSWKLMFCWAISSSVNISS